MTPPPPSAQPARLDPAHTPAAQAYDDFAAAVVHCLNRPLGEDSAWGPGRTLLHAVPTFGLLPLLVWPSTFREFAATERRQLGQFAEWMRLNGHNPESTELRGAWLHLRPRRILDALPLLLSAATVTLFAAEALRAPLRFGQLLDATYLRPFRGGSTIPGLDRPMILFITWSALILLGYLSHWLRVTLHRRDVSRFVGRFDRFAVREGLRPLGVDALEARATSGDVPAPERGRLPWVAGAITLLAGGAFWGGSMMLAGSAQRRYITTTGPRLRAALAARVQDQMLRRVQSPAPRPVAGSVRPRRKEFRCGRGRCQAALAPDARFCPRCGKIVRDPSRSPRQVEV